MPGSIVSPLRLRWVKDVCVIRCNLPPALLAECPRSFPCHCDDKWVERTPNNRQHTKLTLEKKILLPGFELATFRSRVRCSNQQAIPGPMRFVHNDLSHIDKQVNCANVVMVREHTDQAMSALHVLYMLITRSGCSGAID